MKNERFYKLTVILAAFASGMLVMLLAVIVRFGGFANFPYISKFAAVLGIVDRDFVADFDRGEFTDAALAAAVDSIEDDWSYYMNAEQYEDYLDFSHNRYQGIGVTIKKDETTGGFLIREIRAGSPAERAGVQVGEIIVACDGVDVTDGDSAVLKALIQADYGAEAVLTLLGEDGSMRELAVSCEKINAVPVSYEMLSGAVGYVRLENFEDSLAENAIAAVDSLVADGASALIFDVRNNPGGSVSELCELLDHLLPEGDLFIRSDKKGHEVVETSDADCVDLPMAVLINADSYSAAEFFAAALSEYGAATLVGEATTGKGRSQVNYVLSDNSAVHISHYSYLTPNRIDLAETGGLVPDLSCGQGEALWYYAADEKDVSADPQLSAAIEALLS